jgi:putative membrane protein
MFLWVKAAHIIFMVTWFAGLFYLPRLFVYHTQVRDETTDRLFCTMEHKLYYYITTPGAVLTVVFGLWLMHLHGADWIRASIWLHGKLLFVALLIGFHIACGRWLKHFARQENVHSERFFRMVNEIPVIPLVGIVILAVVKPF